MQNNNTNFFSRQFTVHPATETIHRTYQSKDDYHREAALRQQPSRASERGVPRCHLFIRLVLNIEYFLEKITPKKRKLNFLREVSEN